MRIRQLSHSVYQLQYHVVWGTKYRRKILKHYVRSELIRSLYRTQRRFPDWYFHEINTGDDHVHLLSADIYRKGGSVWSAGYFVSSVGLNEQQIRKYIERQNRCDRPVDITGEFS